MRQVQKKRLSARNGGKLGIKKYLKETCLLHKNFWSWAWSQFGGPYRFPFNFLSNFSWLLQIFLACSGLFWVVLACSGLFCLVAGRYFFCKKSRLGKTKYEPYPFIMVGLKRLNNRVKREDEYRTRFGRNGFYQKKDVDYKADCYFCDEKKCLLSHFWLPNAFLGIPNTTNLKLFPIYGGIWKF